MKFRPNKVVGLFSRYVLSTIVSLMLFLGVGSADTLKLSTVSDFNIGESNGVVVNNQAGGELSLGNNYFFRRGPVDLYSSLKSPARNSSSLLYKGYLYVAGGVLNGADTNIVQKISNGTTVNIRTLPFPGSLFGIDGFMKRVYVISPLNDKKAYSAVILDNGDWGDWRSEESLPIAVGQNSAVVYNYRLYVFQRNGSPKYFSAEIGTDGYLRNWRTESDLPFSVNSFSISKDASGIIISGGKNNSDNKPIDTIFRSQFDQQGSIVSWDPAGNLPYPCFNHSFSIDGSIALFNSGEDGRVNKGQLFLTRIDDSSLYNNWSAQDNLTFYGFPSSTLINNGNIYLIDNQAITNDVKLMSLNTTQQQNSVDPIFTFEGYGANNAVYSDGYAYVPDFNTNLSNGMNVLKYDGTSFSEMPTIDFPIKFVDQFGMFIQGRRLYLLFHYYRDYRISKMVSAQLLPEGKVGSFRNETVPYPAGIPTFVNYGNVVIAHLGVAQNEGFNEAELKKLYVCRFDGDGNVSWQYITDLPSDVTKGGRLSHVYLHVHNDRLYILGSRWYSAQATYSFNNNVYSAPLSSDGSIGAWRSEGMSPTNDGVSPASIQQPFFYNSYNVGSNIYLNGVNPYSVKVNSDGTLGTWTQETYYTNKRFNTGFQVSNEIFLIDGTHPTAAISKLDFPIISNAGYYFSNTLNLQSERRLDSINWNTLSSPADSSLKVSLSYRDRDVGHFTPFELIQNNYHSDVVTQYVRLKIEYFSTGFQDVINTPSISDININHSNDLLTATKQPTVNIVSINSGSISVSFNDVYQGEDGYRVLVSTNPEFKGNVLQTITNSTPLSFDNNITATVSSLSPNSHYYVKVNGYKTVGDLSGQDSNVLDFYTAAAIPLLNNPNWISSDVGTNFVIARWNSNGNSSDTSYLVQFATSTDFTSDFVLVTETTTSNLFVSSATSDNWRIVFRVLANGVNNSVTDFVTSIPTTTYSRPSLDYTNETGFVNDVVDPDFSSPGKQFTFRVKYSDRDNDLPLNNYPKLHIFNENQEIPGSPFTMTEVDQSDLNTIDGKLYQTRQILNVGIYSTTIETIDKRNGTADPLSGSGPGVGFLVSGYVLDTGSRPMQGIPITISGRENKTVYSDSVGKYVFTAINGSQYSVIVDTPAWSFNPSTYTYSGISNDLTGQNFIRLNRNPSFSWVGSNGYETDGIEPGTGNTRTNFTFRIKYSDPDNDLPALGQPKVHLVKDGIEIINSPFNMTEVDPRDHDVRDGKDYSITTIFPLISNDMTYDFSAFDIFGSTALWNSEVVREVEPFTVTSNPPTIPVNASPMGDDGTVVSAKVVLSWASSDPDGTVLDYKVFLVSPDGSTSLVYHGPNKTVTLYNLLPGQHYSWYVVATDINAAAQESPMFTFSTLSIDSSKVFNYPNPFNPNKTPTNFAFETGRPEVVTIQIYSEYGDLIFETTTQTGTGSNSWQWDGRDSHGNTLFNGSYVCVIKRSDGMAKGSFMVVR